MILEESIEELSASYFPSPGPMEARGYISAMLPLGETGRIATLNQYSILDTETEQAYDDLTQLASTICGTPISLISLVDQDRQWFKSRTGLEAEETPRELSFCAHAILEPDRLFVVPDTTDDVRFAGNPLVTGSPHIRFYAGAPLLTREGAALGTICVIDRVPRKLTQEQTKALKCLARTAVLHLEFRQTVAQLEEESLTDPLTSIWNRRAFNLRLREEWTKHAIEGKQLSLVMIDIDRFKAYNDQFGHQAGDQALIQTARVLSAGLRTSDFLVRLGGEEFAIVLSDTDARQASYIAERLRSMVHQAAWTHRPLTISIGISSLVPDQTLDKNILVARADQALYHAKRTGRNRVHTFANWMHERPADCPPVPTAIAEA